MTYPRNNKKIIDCVKKKKNKEEKKSGYTNQYYDGGNMEVAKIIGDFLTWNHSEKIKSGNDLEKYISEDVETQGITVYENIKLVISKQTKKNKSTITEMTIDEFKNITTPCLINKLKINKELYDINGLICKNKTSNEIDFVYLKRDADNLKLDIYEVKNGCDFDTKKSKGEIQSLMASTDLFKKLKIYPGITGIVCYDAEIKSDISIKTNTASVKLLMFEDMTTGIGMDVSGESTSRGRINRKIQSTANTRLKIFFDKINSIILNGWCYMTTTQKMALYDKLTNDEKLMNYRNSL